MVSGDNDSQGQNKVHLTKEGLSDLKKKLETLKNEKRSALVERLATARDKGDLSENQEYSQAKEELNLIDGRIEELDQVIDGAVIIGKHNGGSQIALGSKVTVELDGQEIVFHLVGAWEANPSSQKISHQSPLGRQLLGKKPGESVEVEAPVGKLVYKIVKIE